MCRTPDVTAVVTTYKRSWDGISRAIDSILAQTCPVCELLLVDDNDEDSAYSADLREKAKAYPLVRYVPMGKNGGVSKARNRGMQEAKGEYIAFLDDDDEWLPDKLETQLAVFAEFHAQVFVFKQTGLGAYGLHAKLKI